MFGDIHIERRVGYPLAVLCCVLNLDLFAQEWTRFRGPNGSGVGQAENLPTSWTEADYDWRVKLPGVGHSSPVLWSDAIFLTSGDEATGERSLHRIQAADGKIVWSRGLGTSKSRKHSLNSFASSTPAIDAERVYVCWASPQEYQVRAFDHAGKEVWSVDLGPYKAGHGDGASPIVHDGFVIINNDQDGESSLVALDCRTGDVRWRVPRKTKVAYCTPCVYQSKGRPAELIFTTWELGISAIDAASGRTNWELQVFDQRHTETSIGSPFIHGDLVLGTCGYLGYATHTVAVRPYANHSHAEEVFRVDRGAPLTTTPIVANGLLFLWADEGIVSCVDAKTGQDYWRQRVGGTYYGSPVAAGKAIYCASSAGEMVVLAAENEHRLLSRVPLGEGSHSTPAIANSRMYIRTFSHLMSLRGK